jgi:hypothetical protein
LIVSTSERGLRDALWIFRLVEYACTIHPGMEGSVLVGADSA